MHKNNYHAPIILFSIILYIKGFAPIHKQNVFGRGYRLNGFDCCHSIIDMMPLFRVYLLC